MRAASTCATWPRGPTAGDLFVYLPEQRLLFAGDLLTLPILWTWSSYPSDYVRTLRALEALEIDSCRDTDRSSTASPT
jgi:glyoxylase-like metal-dependent hydrolase (beta-lactamase superfamily II)